MQDYLAENEYCILELTTYQGHIIVRIRDHLNPEHMRPRCEKTGLRGFRPGPTQTRLCSHRR